jgi:hypothetical protein
VHRQRQVRGEYRYDVVDTNSDLLPNSSCLNYASTPPATPFYISATSYVGNWFRVVISSSLLVGIIFTELGRIGPGIAKVQTNECALADRYYNNTWAGHCGNSLAVIAIIPKASELVLCFGAAKEWPWCTVPLRMGYTLDRHVRVNWALHVFFFF